MQHAQLGCLHHGMHSQSLWFPWLLQSALLLDKLAVQYLKLLKIVIRYEHCIMKIQHLGDAKIIRKIMLEVRMINFMVSNLW